MLVGTAVKLGILVGKIEKSHDFTGRELFDPQKMAMGKGHGALRW